MTGIEWTDVTWNPVTGCTKVSAGCKNCYAERLAPRVFAGQTVDGRPRSFTDVMVHEERLDAPLIWRKPRRVFVNSMSDLFHESVPDQFIDKVFAVMALAPRHTFQVLTKRPSRMLAYFAGLQETCPEDRFDAAAVAMDLTDEAQCQITNALHSVLGERFNVGWPMRNVWLGVSCEDQRAADERIPLLLQTPAAVRFLSCEPLLGPIDLWGPLYPCGDSGKAGAISTWQGRRRVDWVIVGGESGPGARTCDVAWIRDLVAQCAAAGVPCFVKQLGAAAGLRDRKGGDPAEWPEDLRVREFPRALAAREEAG